MGALLAPHGQHGQREMQGQIEINFAGTIPASRHTSLSGAKVAIHRASSQAARMLVRYLEVGALSDTDMALALGLPEARISARRSMLIKQQYVEHVDIVEGVHGARVCRWQLTVSGTCAAGRIRSER